jgi:hypothetical protein
MQIAKAICWSSVQPCACICPSSLRRPAFSPCRPLLPLLQFGKGRAGFLPHRVSSPLVNTAPMPSLLPDATRGEAFALTLPARCLLPNRCPRRALENHSRRPRGGRAMAFSSWHGALISQPPANTGTASERGGLGDGVRTHSSGEVKQRTTCRHQCTRAHDTKERCVTVSARSPAPSSCAAINKQPGSAAPPGGLQRPNAISSSSSQRSVQVLVSSRHLLLFFSEIGPSPGLVSPSPSQALRDLAASVGSPGRAGRGGAGRWSRAGTDSVIQASCE